MPMICTRRTQRELLACLTLRRSSRPWSDKDRKFILHSYSAVYDCFEWLNRSPRPFLMLGFTLGPFFASYHDRLEEHPEQLEDLCASCKDADSADAHCSWV